MYGALSASKIAVSILGPDEQDKPDSKYVRIATMHRAKGLEFDEVILLLPRNLSSLKISTENMQQLEYVALTRAKS